MDHNRLNAYHIMWLFVFFDLPTNTKKERKEAARFRKDLIRDGFTMMQYSVYIRHCASKESGEVHAKRIKSCIPDKGQVSILRITDKQYSDIMNYWGVKEKPLAEGPKQLEIF
ncbi:MAG: CRISPR-associated endonuclease Cas2 [Bacteroidales bacterium]|nr:CRISPR-associated endonuclease Cas2 [Bacteroidales bacterium]